MMLASVIDLSFFPVTAAFSLVDTWFAGIPFVGFGVAMLVIVFALKVASNRTRPDGTARDSFPSGHAAVSAYVAIFASYAILSTAASSFHQYIIALLLVVWALGVAWSRVRMRRHFVTDVVVGSTVGAAAAAAAAAASCILRNDDGRLLAPATP